MNLFCLLLIAFLSLVMSEETERFHDLDKHGGNEDQMEIMKAMMKRSEIKRREERKSQRMYEYQHRKGRFVSSCVHFFASMFFTIALTLSCKRRMKILKQQLMMRWNADGSDDVIEEIAHFLGEDTDSGLAGTDVRAPLHVRAFRVVA